MQGLDCLRVFQTIGDTFNSPLDTAEILRSISKSVVENMSVTGCHFYLLSRDQRQLEPIASFDSGEKSGGTEPLAVEGIVAEVLHGEAVSVADCRADPRVCPFPAYRQEHIKSLLLVPLESRGQVIGSMHLTTAVEKVFPGTELLEVVRVIAALCTRIILHSMFQRILHDVSETVPTSLDIKEVLQQIVKVITEDLRTKGCLIRMLDPATGKLQLWASYGLSQAYLDKGPVDASKAKTEMLEGKCVAVRDATEYLQYPEEAKRERIASLLSVPLPVHGRCIGVLRIYTHRPYEFSPDEIYLMKIVGEQCALLIHNAQLYCHIRERYDTLMVDFHNWFERFYGWGGVGTKGTA
jgi:GAF domain-containing protein